MTRQAFPIAFVIVDKEDEGVIVFCFEINAPDLVGGGDDSLGKQETCHEDFIVIRCAHQDGKRTTIDNDLQGLLDGNEILTDFTLVVFPSRHLALAD